MSSVETIPALSVCGASRIGYSLAAENGAYVLSHNQTENRPFREKFYPATLRDVHKAAELADSAFLELKKKNPAELAGLLQAIRTSLDQNRTPIIQRIHDETALAYARLEGEMNRTLKQIDQFIEWLRLGRPSEPSIDIVRDAEGRFINDIRKYETGIGPVAVFGAGNFPLAFSTLGTDTISAWAAGCPVIVKAHMGHPGSASMISTLVVKVLQEQNWPEGTFSFLFDRNNRTGQALVRHPKVKAVAFTGSQEGGQALMRLAAKRPMPIPVYAEMGSLNPVLLLPRALEESAPEWAAKLAASITQNCGQLCTRPGLILGIKSKAWSIFQKELQSRLSGTASQAMLNATTLERYNRRIIRLVATGQQPEQYIVCNSSDDKSGAQAVLAIASASRFMQEKELSEEIFGPYSLLVECEDEAELLKVIKNLSGQLTLTLIGSKEDLATIRPHLPLLESKAGRLIINGVPTGVEVCASMHHGGPFPSASHSYFTSVGLDAAQRFLRPVCYQNMPDSLLPAELQNKNPLRHWRRINGTLTDQPVEL